MSRYTSSRSDVVVDGTLADSPPIPYGDFESGLIHVPTGSSLTTLTFYASATENGTYRQIFDSSNAAVSRTVAAARTYAIPAECQGALWLKIVGNADGVVDLTLKS